MKLKEICTVRFNDGRIVCDVPVESVKMGGLRGVAAVEPCLKWRACKGRKCAIKYTTSGSVATLMTCDTVREAVRMIDALREMDAGALVSLLDRFDPQWLRRATPLKGAVRKTTN